MIAFSIYWKGHLVEKHLQTETNHNSHRLLLIPQKCPGAVKFKLLYYPSLSGSLLIWRGMMELSVPPNQTYGGVSQVYMRLRRAAGVSSVTARVSENDMKVEWGACRRVLFALGVQAGARSEERDDNTSRLSKLMKKKSSKPKTGGCSSCSYMAAALSRMGCF